MNNFEQFAASSKVWIYQANRNLTEQETTTANTAITEFTSQWAAHSNALKAGGQIYHNRFLVLMVDESQANASGCSIDSSVHFVQELGKHLNIDFFDRMNIAYPNEGSIATFPLKEFKNLFLSGTLQKSTPIFNNTLTNKQDFDAKWLIPIKDSWLARKIPTEV